MGLLNRNTTITISNRTILRVIAIVIASVMAVRFFSVLSHALTLIFVSFFLALALNPAVSKISHYLPSKSRAWATGAAYIAVLSILVGFFALVIPPLIRQTNEFVREVPQIIQEFKNEDNAVSRFIYRYNFDEQIDQAVSDFSSRTANVKPVVATAGRVGGTLVSIITVIILTFMMLVEGPFWMEKFWELHPEAQRERRKKLAHKMYRVVTAYVNGQLIIATVAAALALIFMVIIGVPNAIALAGIVAIMGLIPLIGNTLGAVLIVGVTLFSSVKLAVIMAVYFLVYQQLENATLQPYIQSRHNELTPLLVFVAALLGASLGGLLGALVSIPVAGCAKILFEDYMTRRGKEVVISSKKATQPKKA